MGFSSFYAGLSGLQSYASQLSVIGNNLANINTIGFKGSRMRFSDLLYQTSFGTSRNPNQIGLGVQTASIDALFQQGSLQGTGVVTDLAIQGNGFFVLTDPTGTSLFTRAGNFSLDKDGNLASATGAFVQGYTTRDINGNIVTSGAVTDINIPTGLLSPPNQTSLLKISANLDSGAVPDDPATPLLNEGETFSPTIIAYDSLGAKHEVTITFTPIDTTVPPDGILDEWTYDATVPGAEVSGGTPGTPFSLASGTVTFDANGFVTSPAADVAITTPAWANGAAAQTITWQIFDTGGSSFLTGFAGKSATSSISQDGFGAGTLRTLTINNEGLIEGIFTNGATVSLAQTAMATFNNPNGLLRAGFNSFFETNASGASTIGTANTGGRGTISAGAIELSNVDITQELTDMITAERGYQANSRVITTTDQIIQEALNLKR